MLTFGFSTHVYIYIYIYIHVTGCVVALLRPCVRNENETITWCCVLDTRTLHACPRRLLHKCAQARPFTHKSFDIRLPRVTALTREVAAGKGFVNELDYQEEALNGEYFSEAIKATPLADVVFAPKVMRDYTTGKVLTTEWIVGERLEKSNAADVSALCSIAMNSYLTVSDWLKHKGVCASHVFVRVMFLCVRESVCASCPAVLSSYRIVCKRMYMQKRVVKECTCKSVCI